MSPRVPGWKIAAIAHAALQRSSALANNRIDVTVRDGRVVLSGAVETAFEKWVAEDYADRTAGVAEVKNDLVVTGPAIAESAPYYEFPSSSSETPWIYAPHPQTAQSAEALEAAVRRELKENALTAPADIRVRAEGGVVTLAGTVGSWSAHSLALNAAYRAGAQRVVDRLRIDLGIPTPTGR